MKYFKLLIILFAAAMLVSSCDDEKMVPGNPVMDVTGDLGSAFFGDTLRFSIKASDAEVPLSTIHAEMYFGSEKVSEQVIRTKVSGAEYPVAIYVPYLANIPDGDATLRLTLQNINFTMTEQNYSVSISHKDYTTLTLVTEDGEEYTMNRESLYTYSVTDNFPQQIKGKIYTPENDYGDKVCFGYENGEIKVNGENYIPFSNATAGTYTITLNTYTFEGTPFITPTINGENTQSIDDNTIFVDLNLSKGASLEFDGFPDFENWWLNPDYIQANPDGNYSFMAYDGNYRFIADLKLKYFKVVKLTGTVPATLNDDGTGNVWILGDGIGYPSTANQPSWNPGKGIPMAPTSDKTYQVTVVGGLNIDVNNIDFKFFGQDDWGVELKGSMLTSESPLIGVGMGKEVNGHDDGNLFLKDGVVLEINTIYVITVDLTGGIDNGILRTSVQGQQQFDEKVVNINGKKMDTFDNSTYSLAIGLAQGENIEFSGSNANLNGIYLDPDYFVAEGNSIKFLPIGGTYNVVLDYAKGTLSAAMVNADGSEMTLKEDGSGALWLMGWGIGSPSMDYQFGWDPGKAYSLAQIAPKVYQFTGKAGPENDSAIGDRLRFDYLSFKFFWQNGWGGEFNDSDYVLGLTGTAADFIQNTGNFELASGVKLEEGATYRMTIDLTGGVNNGTINFEKL